MPRLSRPEVDALAADIRRANALALHEPAEHRSAYVLGAVGELLAQVVEATASRRAAAEVRAALYHKPSALEASLAQAAARQEALTAQPGAAPRHHTPERITVPLRTTGLL